MRANPQSISHRCHLRDVAFEWELTQGTIHLPLGCPQVGLFALRINSSIDMIDIILLLSVSSLAEDCLVEDEKVVTSRTGGNPGANLQSISHRCHLREVAFVWEVT